MESVLAGASAPEQFQGKISKECDQYALGYIAYELFTGHVPFSAPDFVSMWVPPKQNIGEVVMAQSATIVPTLHEYLLMIFIPMCVPAWNAHWYQF